MRPVGQLVEATTGQTVVARLLVADSFWSRLMGLQFRRCLPHGDGLLLAPCNSIHTCCVRFPLDLACLDRQGQVVDLRYSIRPWRIVIPRHGTWAILETAAGDLGSLQLGQRLRIEPLMPGGALPKGLELLS